MAPSTDTSTPAKPPKLRATLTSGEGIVTVKVGPDQHQQDFQIHKALLTHHSEYFRAALQGEWKEAEDRVVVLDDVEPDVFGIFATWLYTGKVPDINRERELALENDGKATTAYLACIKGYALGDRIMASAFCQLMNNGFVDIVDEHGFHVEEVCEIAILAFEQLPAHSLLLGFMVEQYFSESYVCGDSSEVIYFEKMFPHEFLLRGMRRFREMQRGDAPIEEGTRCYHEHTAEEEEKCHSLHMWYDEKTESAYFG
ncbi:hypothetical protein P280DRAFT_260688 [Massarina eburnea CBS 473.64]|uniref:BTB domain-containing protein n=1 Tax=Massarina eburnea CBS 473.64 TaxID=1395130 RepID=A0A6A6S3T5_9PLEO|nr:hypothetical protein P280DRAFT_260688 [Massarina eburnea CBS 473.64]